MLLYQAKSCDDAYIEVRKGISSEGPLVGKYCGAFTETQIKTRASILTAKLVMTSGTFSASYSLGSWTTEDSKSDQLKTLKLYVLVIQSPAVELSWCRTLMAKPAAWDCTPR